MGPLLAMIQHETDCEKLVCCMDTLSFLALDKANRKLVHELHGLDVVLGLFQRTSEPAVLCAAMDSLCSLVKSDDADKVRVCAGARG